MPLNPTSLQRSLEAVFTAPAPDFAVPAARMAAAYASYAAGATSCAGGSPNPATLQGHQALLRAGWTAAYAAAGFVPAAAAQQIAAACTAFWLAPPVDFLGGPTPGAVTVAIPGTLAAALLAVMLKGAAQAATGSPVPAAAAADWARALDLWTRTVVVAHLPPSACVAPVF